MDKYLADIMRILYSILESSERDPECKISTIICIGDMCLATDELY